MWIGSRATTAALAALFLAVAALAYLYPLAMRPLVRPGDQSLVERARRDADLVFSGDHADSNTFPIVTRLSHQSCVELRSTLQDKAGNYLVCYDARTNEKIEERATVGF